MYGSDLSGDVEKDNWLERLGRERQELNGVGSSDLAASL